MTSIPRSKIKVLSKLINENERLGANARLADWTGASAATVKGWQADEGAEHYRSMSATAKRLLATFAYMYATDILDEAAMKKIKRIQTHMEAGKGKLEIYLKNFSRKDVINNDDEDED